MEKITLRTMFETEIRDLFDQYSNGSHKYFWKNGEGQYKEIVEMDLLRGRFVTEDGDFSEFEWEINESRIYMESVKGASK